MEKINYSFVYLDGFNLIVAMLVLAAIFTLAISVCIKLIYAERQCSELKHRNADLRVKYIETSEKNSQLQDKLWNTEYKFEQYRIQMADNRRDSSPSAQNDSVGESAKDEVGQAIFDNTDSP